MKPFTKIASILLGLIIMTSCSNNDGSSPDNTVIAPILDKWWYASYCCNSDIYIHSDGRYEQRDEETNIITDTGNWTLVDEDLAIIKVDYDEGTNQVLSAIWLGFLDIQEHSIAVSQSTDGTNFYEVSLYQDTDKIFP